MALGIPGPGVFLDKVCIHQTDLELKAEGVKSLAGFLKRSKSALVVYNEHYLRRLWTVYEFATILIVNPEIELRIIPKEMAPMILSMVAVSYTFGVMETVG